MRIPSEILSTMSPSSSPSSIQKKSNMFRYKEISCSLILRAITSNARRCTIRAYYRGYICERLKSFGDCKFLEMAENLLQLEDIMPEMERRVLKCKEFDDASLQDFLGEMENKMFMSQYSQNLLVISKKLIEFLGFNF